jgi:hypothetical protein
MTIGICAVCKGPVTDEEPLVLFQRNFYHVSTPRCEWLRDQIEKADAKFLKDLLIDS